MGAVAACFLIALLASAGASVFLVVRLVLSHVAPAGGAGVRGRLRERAGERGLAKLVACVAEKVPPVGKAYRAFLGRKRARELQRSMPEALRLLNMSLNAGNSVTQALRFAAESCPEPLASELQRAVWDLEAGKGFDAAMAGLRSRTGGSEFAYLAVALEIQHKSGGSLGEVLASVQDSLRQAAKLDEELRTKTTQGRLSARIVAVMPVVLLAVLSLFSGNYLEGFFASPLGVALFALAIVLECAGVLLVRRTLALDLSSGRRT